MREREESRATLRFAHEPVKRENSYQPREETEGRRFEVSLCRVRRIRGLVLDFLHSDDLFDTQRRHGVNQLHTNALDIQGGGLEITLLGILSLWMVFKDKRPDKIPDSTNTEIKKRRGKRGSPNSGHLNTKIRTH